MTLSISKASRYIRSFALGVIIVGVPLGMYMNYFISDSQWSNVIMFFGILFLADWTNVLKWRFPSWNKHLRNILLFQLLCLLYFVISTVKEVYNHYLYFHLFIIGLIFALASNCIDDRKGINFKAVIFSAWVLSLFCSVLALFCLRTGLIMNYSDNIAVLLEENLILEHFTMSSGCVTNVIASLYLVRKKSIYNYLIAACVLLDLYCMFLLTKRTPIVIAFLVIGFYLYKTASLRKILSWRNVLFSLIIIFSISWVLSGSTTLTEQIDNLWSRLTLGVNDMFYGTDYSGGESGNSAAARYYAREWALDYIFNDFSIVNYFIGAGYMTKWLDIPILQSYLDMGICGLITYTYYVVWKPLSVTFSRLSTNSFVMFACSICYYNVFSTFNSGNPYGFVKWIPIVVLVFVLANKRNIMSTKIEEAPRRLHR